jgi:hypothetical protein
MTVKMTVRSSRSRTNKEVGVGDGVGDGVGVGVKVHEELNNKKSKKTLVTVKQAVLPLKTQNLIIRTVLDRLDGKTVILHKIDRTKS